MAIQDRDLFMTSAEVVNFINAYALGRGGSYDFDAALKDLYKMRDRMLRVEEDFYTKLGTDKKTLRDRFRTLADSTSLYNFSNEALSKSGDLKELQLRAGTDNIHMALNKFFMNQPDIMNSITDAGDDLLETIFAEQSDLSRQAAIVLAEKFKGRKKKRKIVISALEKQMRDYVTGAGNRFKTGAYKADLLKLTGKQVGETLPTYEFRVTIPNDDQTRLLQWFPYFRLSAEGKRAAEADIGTWELFKGRLADIACADGCISRGLALEVLSNFTVRDFCVDTVAYVKGIFGEVQAALLFAALTGNSDSFEVTGNEMVNGAKLGADLILQGLCEQAGIQVKNYRTISSAGGDLWNLHDQLAFNTLWSRARDNEAFADLATYLGFKYYNRPVSENSPYATDTLPEYRKMYKNLTNDKGSFEMLSRAIVAMEFDSFFTLEQQRANESFYLQTFWVFGGKELIPSSDLLGVLIFKIKKLIEAYQVGKGTLNMGELSVHYTAPERDEEREWPSDEVRTVSEVLQEVKVRFNMRVYMGDIFNYVV